MSHISTFQKHDQRDQANASNTHKGKLIAVLISCGTVTLLRQMNVEHACAAALQAPQAQVVESLQVHCARMPQLYLPSNGAGLAFATKQSLLHSLFFEHGLKPAQVKL